MSTKVYELAKELNIPSKELVEKIQGLGIDVKSHMSSLSDSDVELIKSGGPKGAKAAPAKEPAAASAPAKAPAAPGKRPPIGSPAGGAKRPAWKPVISKEIEARTIGKDGKIEKSEEEIRKVKEAEEAKKAAEAQKVKDAKAAEEAKKAAPKEAEKKAAPKKEEKKPEKEKPVVGVKIIKSAEEVHKDEKEREARKAEQKAEKKAEKKPERKSQPAKGDKRPEKRTDRDRSEKGDRPRRNDDRPRNPRQQREERPALDKMETKPNQKRDDKGHHDKDRDRDRNKFAKLENGGKKSKKAMKERSLEKAAKPKKHKDYKQVVEEPEVEEEPLPLGTKVITVPITVGGFCEQVEASTSKVIMTLMRLGVMATINQNLDEDTCMLLAEELGIQLVIGKVEQEEEVPEGIENFEDKEEDLKTRAPIITVMGHVDHGKTSLLDAIRKTNVTSTESGGITQHIGASEVKINGQKIVFLDTPGHEAFTAMRARGAMITDIAVLVVAADDSVKPQTIESISHAKAAGVPIIVAINKIDKPGANPDRVKQDLTEHGILVEDWGGDVICVPVSAKTGEGITNLLEMILLQAEVLELRANPNRLALGTVIEARLDKTRGPVATLLVTNGTLKSGMSVVAGTCSGRIRLMTNHKGETIKKAGPATAVEILGLTDVPQAGDEFNAVKEDKIAREIAENRKQKLREEVLARNASSTLEQLFSQIEEGEVKDLNLIIKGDVQGSVGAIVASLEKLNNENVRVKIVHTGVGTVNESDVMLASTTGSIIIGFNVRPTTAIQTMADRDNIQIRLYRVIYDIINDVEDAMKGMLDPEFKEEVLGKAEVRSTFKVPGVGIIAGAYVQEGKVMRNAEIRLVRDGIVIHEGLISSLKRFKDDAKEVAKGFECGIGIEDYNDIKDGDVIECFHMVEIERN